MEEDASNIISRLNVTSHSLQLEVIQEVLIKAKKSVSLQQNNIPWAVICDSLWLHLNTGLSKFDDQLLCATCFYSALILLQTEKQEYYCNEVLKLINKELALKKVDKVSTETANIMSLMYGMFQSSFLLQKQVVENLTKVFQVTFELLIRIAYEYSRFTYIAFKTLTSLKKVIGTELERHLFNKDNQVILLNLTNHNWENPITGVRDLNRVIFQTLLTVVDGAMYDKILEEISKFYWNKAKYLMLTETVAVTNKDIKNLMVKYNWIEGLIYSLYKPGLVSAGADLYYAIFKKLNTAEEWCDIFLKPVTKILKGHTRKAIENFNNYWCLTTLKIFPFIAELILNELQNMDCKYKLYSTLCILKQVNKLGLLKKNWGDMGFKETAILEGLDSCDNNVRMLAFDIMCVSQNKTIPTNLEYNLILNFLKNNINSDCTVLRISMLNSFGNFLTFVHMTFLNSLKTDGNNEMENLEQFCVNFQQLIIESLNLNGNYQRKITCIKLANTFFNGITEVPRKRQKQTRQSRTTILATLREKELLTLHEERVVKKLISLLKDPAEDIRENVTQLLLKHYLDKLKRTDTLNSLISQALESMRSKFFYEISCGQSMFKLIVNLLIKEEHENGDFKNCYDIFNFASNELKNEFEKKRSVVEAIENGKQLHSFISILQAVLEVSLEQSQIIPSEKIEALIEVLEAVSNQFTWEEESATSSDFSKMSDMVQDIIVKAGFVSTEDETKISGMHQIVLNCLWLNVKASCELASLIIRYQKMDSRIVVCEKCLHIITHVLETCRHKGAIEAAGAALGQAIQYLTSLLEDSALSNLPYSLLQHKLKELITEASKMASVTRRGAGLSIMVHRIVSSDSKRGKPLFHYFMKTLLETCNKIKTANQSTQETESDNEKDLPQAIYIHFLTRIVTDSSLASDMMFYSAELAELAFDNLTSPLWQIRNAALQLYGALIPKLIGQKKVSGTDEETIATVACDEFRTHSPKLWQHIQACLRNKDYEDKLQYHSNLVPILNLLANSAKRYNFLNDETADKSQEAVLLKSLFLLLDSPIYAVRRLAAHSIYNLFSSYDIIQCILNEDCISENFLHGSLMLVGICYKNYSSNLRKIDNLKAKFKSIFDENKHSYLSRKLFEDVFCEYNFNLDFMQETLAELHNHIYVPGAFVWANNRMRKVLENIPWSEIPDSLKLIMKEKGNEYNFKFILDKLNKDDNAPEEILYEIANILIANGNVFENSAICEILYEIVQKVNLHGKLYLDYVSKVLHKDVTYKLRYFIPFTAKIYTDNIALTNDKELSHLASIIYKLTNPEVDIDMRQIAALSNNELSKSFDKLPEEIKVAAVKSAVILLQDEDEDVRVISVEFFSNVSKTKNYHPYICLTKLLDVKFLSNILTNNGVEQLYKELNDFLSEFSNNKPTDDYNPFANDSRNIYLEVEVLKQLIDNLKSV